MPPPELKGPRLSPFDIGDGSADAEEDVKEVQALLVARGVKETDVVDGVLGEKTSEAIKTFQASTPLAALTPGSAHPWQCSPLTTGAPA